MLFAVATKGDACFFSPPRRVQRWSSLAELLLPASSLTRNTRRQKLAKKDQKSLKLTFFFSFRPHLGIALPGAAPRCAKLAKKRPKIIFKMAFFFFFSASPRARDSAPWRRPGVTGAPRAAPRARPARGGGHPGSAPGKHLITSGQRGPSRGAPHPPPLLGSSCVAWCCSMVRRTSLDWVVVVGFCLG